MSPGHTDPDRRRRASLRIVVPESQRRLPRQLPPELDLDGLATRVETYKHAGCFPPHQAEEIIAGARASGVTLTPNFLGRFVELFAT